MKNILIDDKKYLVPEDWNEITLGKFQEIQLWIEKSKENNSENEIETLTGIISILTGCPEEIIRKIPISAMEKLVEIISFVTTKQPEFKDELTKSIVLTIDGKTFAFDHLMEHLSFGQIIDADVYMRGNKFWENAHKVLSVIIRPATERSWLKRVALLGFIKRKGKMKTEVIQSLVKYEVEPYNISSVEERSQLFKNKMLMSDAFAISLFFCGLRKESKKIIQDYGQADIPMTEKKNSQIDGAGILPFGITAVET